MLIFLLALRSYSPFPYASVINEDGVNRDFISPIPHKIGYHSNVAWEICSHISINSENLVKIISVYSEIIVWKGERYNKEKKWPQNIYTMSQKKETLYSCPYLC